jgi:hypothetical protein
MFVQGPTQTSDGYLFAASHMNSVCSAFYFGYSIVGYFVKVTFHGSHAVLTLPFDHLICSTKHCWLHCFLPIELNCRTWSSFILISPNQESFNQLCATISFVPFPHESHHFSPFNFARMVNTPIKDLTKEWTEGVINNFFISLC